MVFGPTFHTGQLIFIGFDRSWTVIFIRKLIISCADVVKTPLFYFKIFI